MDWDVSEVLRIQRKPIFKILLHILLPYHPLLISYVFLYVSSIFLDHKWATCTSQAFRHRLSLVLAVLKQVFQLFSCFSFHFSFSFWDRSSPGDPEWPEPTTPAPRDLQVGLRIVLSRKLKPLVTPVGATVLCLDASETPNFRSQVTNFFLNTSREKWVTWHLTS